MMKNILFFLLISFSVTAQTGSKIDSGSVKNVDYRILFPEKWEKKLVMFAHGHEYMGQPNQIKENRFIERMKPFLDRGFAVAASNYTVQGFSMPQGIDDTEELRRFFVNKYGKPDTTFIVGQSLGGGVTLGTVENFPSNYKAALALCPFSSRPYLQCRKEFEMYAIANALFPEIVPQLSVVMNPSLPYKAINPRVAGPKLERIKIMLARDSVSAVQFAQKFDIKYKDLPSTLAFNENILRDISKKSGGNPFDNTNTIYTGFLDDIEINKKVERIAANVNQEEIFGKYDRTGDITIPVVAMHTIYDPVIPPTYGIVNFENMVHKQGKDLYFTVKYTNGQGHCAFTSQQIGKTFDEMRIWAKTGMKATAGFLE